VTTLLDALRAIERGDPYAMRMAVEAHVAVPEVPPELPPQDKATMENDTNGGTKRAPRDRYLRVNTVALGLTLGSSRRRRPPFRSVPARTSAARCGAGTAGRRRSVAKSRAAGWGTVFALRRELGLAAPAGRGAAPVTRAFAVSRAKDGKELTHVEAVEAGHLA
jgi:hypothetical protein